MISFIIPTKDEEHAIASILINVSKYKGAKEIIVSDGRSKDATIEIAKKYTNNIVEPTSDQKQTIADGRNCGAAVAKGEFLVFIDADTSIFDPDHFFKICLQKFSDNKKLGALTVYINILPHFATRLDKLVFWFMNTSNLISNNFLGVGAAMGEFQMIRRDVFNEIGGYDKRLAAGEDYDMFRRIAKKYQTRVVSSVTIYHTGRRIHKVGWHRLLPLWFMNYVSAIFFKKSYSKEWTEVR